METAFAHLNRLFESTPQALRHYRWLCLLLFVAMSAASVLGLNRNFIVNVSPEAWFEDGAEPLEFRNQFRRQFGSDEGVYIVYRSKTGDVFSETALSQDSFRRLFFSNDFRYGGIRLKTNYGAVPANPIAPLETTDNLLVWFNKSLQNY